MKLAESSALAWSLERGLGEGHWLIKTIHPQLRLRSSVCGLTSIALAEHFRLQGHKVNLIVSSPELEVDMGKRHAFPVVETDTGSVIIDATYSQFLEYTGLTPGYVMRGGQDLYPAEKIAIMPYGDAGPTASRLASAGRSFLENHSPIFVSGLQQHSAFADYTESEMESVYKEIWSERNFDTWVPPEEMLDAGLKLAEFVLPGQVRLIA